MPKFGRKFSHFRCMDSHTSFKVKRSKIGVTGGRGHTVSAEPGGDTACFQLFPIFVISVPVSEIILRLFPHLTVQNSSVGEGARKPLVCLQSAIDKAMADYDLIEGFNYNLSMDDFNIK